MDHDVKSVVIEMRNYCLESNKVRGVVVSRKCIFHYHILVLEALTPSEQDALAERVMPSEARAEEICKAFKINMTVYDRAIQGYLRRLPAVQSNGYVLMNLDSEEHFKMIENLGKKRKKRAKD